MTDCAALLGDRFDTNRIPRVIRPWFGCPITAVSMDPYLLFAFCDLERPEEPKVRGDSSEHEYIEHQPRRGREDEFKNQRHDRDPRERKDEIVEHPRPVFHDVLPKSVHEAHWSITRGRGSVRSVISYESRAVGLRAVIYSERLEQSVTPLYSVYQQPTPAYVWTGASFR